MACCRAAGMAWPLFLIGYLPMLHQTCTMAPASCHALIVRRAATPAPLPQLNGKAVPDFPDLFEEGAEAMDYEASVPGGLQPSPGARGGSAGMGWHGAVVGASRGGSLMLPWWRPFACMPCPHLLPTLHAARSGALACGAEGARVFVIVDTNILLSHLSFLKRTFDDFMGQAMDARWGLRPGVEPEQVAAVGLGCDTGRLLCAPPASRGVLAALNPASALLPARLLQQGGSGSGGGQAGGAVCSHQVGKARGARLRFISVVPNAPQNGRLPWPSPSCLSPLGSSPGPLPLLPAASWTG